MMTSAMESKEEISDTDSGIILHSGKQNYINFLSTIVRFRKEKKDTFIFL